MPHPLSGYAMVVVGVVVILAGVAVWVRIESGPDRVAIRAADVLFSDPAAVAGLPLQGDELRTLDLTPKQGAAALAAVRKELLPHARVFSRGKFLEQPGKDALLFQVEVEPGVVVDAALPVIDDDGHGVVQMGDLALVYRSVLMRLAERGSGDRSALDRCAQILAQHGMKGYYDVSHNRVESWPAYAPASQ